MVSLGGSPIGSGTADENGAFVVSGVVPNIPLGRYAVETSCGVPDVPSVDVTAPEAGGGLAPAAGVTTAAVLLFFLLAGNAVLRWFTGDASGGGFHAG